MEQKLVAEWKPDMENADRCGDTKLNAEEEDSLVTARRIRQPIASKTTFANGVRRHHYSKAAAAVIAMFEKCWARDVSERRARLPGANTPTNATAADFLRSLSAASGRM